MVDACGRDSQSPWCQKVKEEETGVLGEGHSVTLRPPTPPSFQRLCHLLMVSTSKIF